MGILIKKSNINKENIPIHFIIFDCETYPVETIISKKIKIPENKKINEHKLSFGYAFYYELINNNYIKKDELFFENAEQFTTWILKKSDFCYGSKLYIFAHNIGYDYRVCINDEILKDADYKLKVAISTNSFIYKFIKKNYSIYFLSTTNFFRTSLKELGLIFSLKKLDFKFNENGSNQIKNKTEKAKIYCYRDVEILEKVCINLFYFIKNRCQFSNTIASTAFNIFRYNYYNENIIMHKNPEIEEIEKQSYYGGRTDCFRIGRYKNIYKLDINSMYPYSMKNEFFPIELIKKINYNGKNNKELLINLLNENKYLIIANVKININDQKIPFRDIYINKLIYPIGKFKTILCNPELKLLDQNEIIECYEILLYKKEKIFEKFVDDYYNLRLKYKKENNDIMQYFCKIILNSLYGKFAQKNTKEERNDKYDNIISTGYIDLHIDEGIKKLKIIKGEAFEINNEESGYNTFISISAFVTSYSRVLLWSMIKNIISEIYYIDTDSIFCSKKGYDYLYKNNYIDNKEIGKLKLEGILNTLSIRNVKDYSDSEFINVDYYIFRNNYVENLDLLKYDNKIKGLKKDSLNEAIKNGEDITNKKEWKIKRILGFNESIRYFNLFLGDIEENKNIKRIYEKGYVDDNGYVHPFILNA